jgi:putative hydrolase of the HAD superfamily
VIEAVLFDWGHTLVRSELTEELALEGTRIGLTAIGRNGLPRPQAINGYFSERLEELFPVDAEVESDLRTINRDCFLHLGCELSDDEGERFLEATQRFWTESYETHPRIAEAIHRLREDGLKLALVSNNVIPIRYFVVPFTFDCIVLSSEVGKRKPHPAVFERALEELEVDPARAVFVGDRLDQDVAGAAALGMRTVQAAWFYRDENGQTAVPDLVANDPLEVVEWLERFRS